MQDRTQDRRRTEWRQKDGVRSQNQAQSQAEIMVEKFLLLFTLTQKCFLGLKGKKVRVERRTRNEIHMKCMRNTAKRGQQGFAEHLWHISERGLLTGSYFLKLYIETSIHCSSFKFNLQRDKIIQQWIFVALFTSVIRLQRTQHNSKTIQHTLCILVIFDKFKSRHHSCPLFKSELIKAA